MAVHKTNQGVESAEVVGAILKGMVALVPPFRLKDLEEVTQIPAPKIHRYLVSMIECGLVRRSEEGSRYDFGLLAYSLGHAAQNNGDLVSAVAPRLMEFAQSVGESVGIARWIDDGATIIRWFESGSDLSIALRAGARLGLTSSSTGRLFGAYLPREITEPLVRRELEASGEKPGAKLREIYREFAEIREAGIARGLGTRVRGIHSISAPVFDHSGSVAACITVLGPEGRLDASMHSAVYKQIAALAKSISTQLGYAPKAR
jgi:DNA-binding IclR family transcriptional regulator